MRGLQRPDAARFLGDAVVVSEILSENIDLEWYEQL